MVEPTGNRQNEYTKKAVKTEIQEWVEEYVYEVLEGDERFASVSGIDGDPDDDPIIPPEPPENRLVSIKFLNDAGTEYVDPRDSNGNFIAFGDVVTEKDGKVYVNVKAEIQDDRDKETVEYWKIQLDGGFVREKQEVKKFTYKNLEPNKEYTTVVRSFDKNNKGIGTSGPIRFKTKLVNNPGDKPPAVTNLQGSFDGSDLVIRWEYLEFPNDFDSFVVRISNQNNSISNEFHTQRTKSFSLPFNLNNALFNGIQSTLNVCVYVENRREVKSNESCIVVNAQACPPPTGVTLQAARLGYIVDWNASECTGYQSTIIYESSSENGTYTERTNTSTHPIFVSSGDISPRFIKVAHVNYMGIISELVASTPKSVTPEAGEVVDITPPEQRTGITYTPGTESVTVAWTNPSGNINDDVSGVTIKYAEKTTTPRYKFIDIPFTSQTLIATTTVEGLLPLTTYLFSVGTYDKVFNRTSYSTETEVTTLADSVAPPKPQPPLVAAGNSNDGPMTVRVQQEAVGVDGTTPLPLDTSLFQIWMNTDANNSSSPSDALNTGAILIGTMTAGFYGGETQGLFFVPSIESGGRRYFYTRAVDRAGNISPASNAVQSTAMTVFSDAHISNLSANKITTDFLNTSTEIKVGNQSNRIVINGSGLIYSGVGQFNDDDTPFYISSTGQFSISDLLSFNPSGIDPITGSPTGLLSIKGSIEARSGSFTGNVQIKNSGKLFIGSSADTGRRIVLGSTGITAYIPSESNPSSSVVGFELNTDGTNLIAGWSIKSNALETDGVRIDSTNKRIRLFNPSVAAETVGIQSTVSGGISIWAGTENPSTSSPFYVTNTGKVVASNAEISGVIKSSQGIFNGLITIPDLTLLTNEGDRDSTLIIDSVGTGNAYISMVRRSFKESAIEFFTSRNSGSVWRRGRIAHEGGTEDTAGGRFQITAYPSSTGATSGVLNLNAVDGNSSNSTINLNASRVLVNGVEIASGGESLGGYYNRSAISRTNRISYSTLDTSSVTGTLRDGDLHFEYVN